MNLKKQQKLFTMLKISATSFILLIFSSVIALADSKVVAKSADEVANQAVDKLIPIFKAFGGLCVLGGVAIVGFKLIFANKNPDKRAETMSGLMWTGIGAFIVGSAMLVAGFLWGLGADPVPVSSMIFNFI